MLNAFPATRRLLALVLACGACATSFYFGRSTTPVKPHTPILPTDALSDLAFHDPDTRNYVTIVQQRLEKEASTIKQAGAGRIPQAFAVSRDGFVFVLHPDGRASVVQSDGIVRPVVSDWTPGLSPFYKPILHSNAESPSGIRYRAFDFSTSGLVFDPELDVIFVAGQSVDRKKNKSPTHPTP